MSEAADDVEALRAELQKAQAKLSAMEPVRDALAAYASARARLPAPGKDFNPARDMKNFQAYFAQLLVLERAAMDFVGRSVKQ
jgi:hypothetical protein